MKRCLPALCMVACLWAYTSGASPVLPMAHPAHIMITVADSIPTTKTYHYKVFTKPDGTYGYDIFTGPKKFIHQETIPGQPGNKGFARENAAAKVAGLVISKLQQNIFPPAITAAELRQLGVL